MARCPGVARAGALAPPATIRRRCRGEMESISKHDLASRNEMAAADRFDVSTSNLSRCIGTCLRASTFYAAERRLSVARGASAASNPWTQRKSNPAASAAAEGLNEHRRDLWQPPRPILEPRATA